MSSKQQTLKAEITISGTGLHTGNEVNMRIRSAQSGGIVFVRTDLDNIRVNALSSNVTSTARGTTIGSGTASVSTVEHVMAALAGSQIDHAVVEIDGPECPILDGSSIDIVRQIDLAGTQELDTFRESFSFDANVEFKDEETGAEYLVIPSDRPQYTVMIDYNSQVMPPQHAVLKDMADFKMDVAPSRTFCFLHELEFLLDNGLIKGGGLENAVVFVDEPLPADRVEKLEKVFGIQDVHANQLGVLNNTELRSVNEPARHKLLDLIGDLALLGVQLNGHIIATKPGHGGNSKFSSFLTELIKEKRKPQVPHIGPDTVPIMDINGIMAKLPHRPPFLFIDRIYELSETHVVGAKNVSMNEDFFKGHFPGAPVLPGVIQIEAMAQTGGILVLSTVPDPENYLTYFIKIDKVKFRKMVMPGDTIVFRLDLLSPIRRGLCQMKGTAYVGKDAVMEAEMVAQIVKRENT